MIRFDAYSATTTEAHQDDLAQLLFDQVGLSGTVKHGKGFHQFAERVSFKDHSGDEVGAVQWGGRHEGRVMIEVKGETTPKVVEALRSRFPHRCTRVDSCADFDGQGSFDRLLGACTSVKRKHRIIGGKAGDWDDFPEKGRTLYLGSTQSATRLRLYEKGLQPQYAHLERPNWVRIETQVRPEKEAKEAFATLSPLDVWGSSRWTRDLAAEVLEGHVDPHPAGTTYRLSERENALRWMCKQYGKHLVSLAADLGNWENVGLTLNELLKEQDKGRS
jgi:hypothetical protein